MGEPDYIALTVITVAITWNDTAPCSDE